MTDVAWPDGKRFAFTVFDDTDLMTCANGPPLYQFLQDTGFRTTKSVWPLKGPQKPEIGGATCADAAYLDWLYRLRQQGFELALHNVAYHTSNRGEILRGLERYKELFGTYPKIQVNHADCRDSLYWGAARLSGVNRLVYNLLTRFRKAHFSQGHIEGSPLFWGDLCQQHIKYVRNFVYADINTLKACPYMPYFDSRRPFVNYWFASSEGGHVRSFNKTIAEHNQDRLEEEGGACIMYTHFAKGFYTGGRLEGRFRQLMERLSRKPGWFVPVSTLLDFLLQRRGSQPLSNRERFGLEAKWLVGKVLRGGTS